MIYTWEKLMIYDNDNFLQMSLNNYRNTNNENYIDVDGLLKVMLLEKGFK